MNAFFRYSPLAALGVLTLACANGGTEDRPLGEVQLTTVQHLFGLVASRSFADYPIRPNEVGPVSSIIQLRDDGTYRIEDDNTQRTLLLEDRYALEEIGQLSLLQSRTNASTLVFRGGVDLASNTETVFFTDRLGSNVGLYVGNRFREGIADLDALGRGSPRWHLFSMHLLFSPRATVPDPNRVGRAFAGPVTLGRDGKVAGRGQDSANLTGAQLAVDGSLSAFQDGLGLTLDYGSETRTFRAGGASKLILGVGESEATDRAAGLVAMVAAHRDEVDIGDLAGRWTLGLWTIFVNPTAAGTDAGVGTLEIARDGAFRLAALNADGLEFGYSGSAVSSTDPDTFGWLELTIDGTNETWFGAVDRDLGTLILLDPFREQRANGQSELNFVLAVREAD